MDLEPNITLMDTTGMTYCALCSERVYADSDYHVVPATTTKGAHATVCNPCYLNYTGAAADIGG